MTATPVVGNTFFGLDISGLSGGFASIRRQISRSTLLIELAPRILQVAEARQRSSGLEIRHFTRVPLPDGALERSVPTDPDAMAQLLRDLCIEKGIVSHRAAVVLPPELAFQRLLQLPAGLSSKEARNYLLDPRNGVTLPFPLAQTDFDLVPITSCNSAVGESGLTTYQLTAIPVSLVDPVLSMLDVAGFDLQALELGSLSPLRLIKDELLQLPTAGVSLLLEFLPDTTLVNIICAEGLIESERLPSIREFPRYELTELERELILNRSHSLEEVTVENERYLPLSEMDLRAFSRDLEEVLTSFSARFPGLNLDHTFVFGESAAHPDLPGLIRQNLNCPVKKVRPFLANGLRDWSLDEPLLQCSLIRLVGLGLGLLSDVQVDSKSVSTITQDTVLDDIPQTTKLDVLVTDVSQVEAEPVPVTESVADEAEVEVQGMEEKSASVVEADESGWPSLKLDVGEEVIEEEEKVVDEAEVEVQGMEEKSASVVEADESGWPSLKLDVGEEVIEEEEKVVDEAEIEAEGMEEKSASVVEGDESGWPSLKLDVGEVVMEEEEKVADEAEVEVQGMEEKSASVVEGDESGWPSLKLDVGEVVMEEEEKVADGAEIEVEGMGEKSASVVESDESGWPSLKLDENAGVSMTLKSDLNPARMSNMISESPSVMNRQASQPPEEVLNERDDKNYLNDSSNDHSPLGELRFRND